MSGRDRTSYRYNVKCGICKKIITADYRDSHTKQKHPGKSPAYAKVHEKSQMTLGFESAQKRSSVESPSQSSSKHQKIDSICEPDSTPDRDEPNPTSDLESAMGTNTDECLENELDINSDVSSKSNLSCGLDSQISDPLPSPEMIFDVERPSTSAENPSVRPMIPMDTSVTSHTSEMKEPLNLEQSSDSDSDSDSDCEPESRAESVGPKTLSALSTSEMTAENDQQSESAIDPPRPILESYFPKKCGREKTTRDFRKEWFAKYPWLGFYVESKTARCYPCEKYLKKEFQFQNWKKEKRLTKHSCSKKNHREAMSLWLRDKKAEREQRKVKSVIDLLDENHAEIVRSNREYLKVIIETLLFTAQQNIAQRSHVESRTNLEDDSDTNRGNFLELIHLRAKDIPWLKEKLKSQMERHRAWLSPEIQNEIINIIADFVFKEICEEILGVDYVSVILDETSDISRIEQVAICISYVFKGVKKETFVGFYDTKSTEGITLYQLLLEALSKLGLDPAKIVGECFDGASNVREGKEKGLATRMKECSPLAIYVHCYGHRLNLALNDVMTEIEILRKTLGAIQALYNFIEASPKRHAIYQDVETNESLRYKLKPQSETRWCCRYEAVKAVDCELERIIKTLLLLSDDKNTSTYANSRSLLKSICDFQFVLGLKVLKLVFSNTNALSRYLQGKKIDVSSASKTAAMTRMTLNGCRNERDFELLIEQTTTTGRMIENLLLDSDFDYCEAKLPRRSQLAEHADAKTAIRSHFRINVYYAVLDKVDAELNARFAGKDNELLCALGDVVFSDRPSEASFTAVANHYSIDCELLRAEKNHFLDFISSASPSAGDFDSDGNAAELAEYFYQNDLHSLLPILTQVVLILACIPATSCSAERSFSALRRLKSYLRNTMKQDRLNSLALINIERAITNRVMQQKMDEIIDTFGRRRGREQYFF